MTAESITGIKGTPIYISPEIWNSSEYSTACDVYAFAFIVYELITNEKPYKGCQLFQILAKITNGIRPEFTFDIPESYKNLIEHCWEQNPNDRLTFAEILQMLKSDPGFITDLVDQDDFFRYVEYIDGIQIISSSINNTQTKQDQKVVEKISQENKSTGQQHKIVEDDDSINDIKSDEDLENIFLKALTYVKGDGVAVNLKKAARLYKIAADQGHQYSIYNYADACLHGKGVPVDKRQAFKYYKMAADMGDINALYNCGVVLYDDEGDLCDKKEGAKYFKMAALKGSVSGMNRYALAMSIRDSTPENLKEAALFYKMAADKGNISCMHNYALFCYNGVGTTENKEEAAKYYKLGADFGHIECMKIYASMNEKGDGIPINKKEAAKYYKMGADVGDKEALEKYNYITSPNYSSLTKEQILYFDLKKEADEGQLESIKQLASRLIFKKVPFSDSFSSVDDFKFNMIQIDEGSYIKELIDSIFSAV